MMNAQEAHPAWATRLSFELGGLDQQAQALVAGLDQAQLNWQPTAGSWSVGQCLEHLCMTNEAYLAPMSLALEGKADAPVEQITPGWLSGWFLKSFVEPSPNAKKVPAPGKIRPTSEVSAAVIERFLANNKACRELIVRARKLGHHAIIAGIDSEQAASMALHAKFGFVKVGHLQQVGRKFERWLDVVYLELVL